MLKPTSAGLYRNRTIPSMVLVMVLRGQGTATDWQGREHRVHAGDMIFLPPDLPHSVVQDPDGQWAEFYLNFDPRFYEAVRQLCILPPDRFVFHATMGQAMLAKFEDMFETIRMLTPDGWPMMWAKCHLILADILTQDSQKQQSLPPLKRQMLEAANLLADPSGRKLSLPGVARKLGMSYESFRKQFRQEMGISPGELRIRSRMELARKLIADHRLTSKEVAYRLGYADPFTFSKQFRRYTGQSPREFRQESCRQT